MGVALRNPLARLLPEEREQRGRKSAPVGGKPARKPRGKPAAVRKKAAKGSASRGATRKLEQRLEKAPRNFAWLNRILILIGAGVVLVAALQAYITLQSIPVQQITVTGELAHTRTSTLQDMVQPALAGGFLGADLQQLREQLEALPWIYQARVRRVWPNALEIHVVEQLPIARWGEEGFLNHEGQIFRPSRVEQWQALPLLHGPEGAAQTLMSSYQRIGDILAPLDLRIEQLLVDERGQVEAILSGDMHLVLGGEHFLQRMRRFVTVYRAELVGRAGEIERVDLRYRSGIAVVFREPPVTADEQAKG